MTVSIQRPGYRLVAGYNISGQLYLQEDELSDFGKQQQFFAAAYYQISPSVSFTLNDSSCTPSIPRAHVGGGVGRPANSMANHAHAGSQAATPSTA